MNSENKKILSSGVSQMFFATFAFFLANVFVKQVSDIPVMEVVFFRCLVAAGFCVYGLQKAKASFFGSNQKLLIARGFFGTLALALFFLTVQNIPLATAMVVQYLSPIFTAIIAIFFLKEKVKPIQWIFYAVAFAGVLFIGQVDARVSFLFIFLGVVSAFGSGAAYNIVRRLKDSEHPLTIILYFQIVGIIAGGLSIPFGWKMPQGIDWIYLFLIGAFSQLGQVFLTNAFSREKAASVAIIVYTGLIYSITVGWIYYGEKQTIFSLIGMILVVAGVVASVIYGKRQKDAEILEEEIESSVAP